MRHRRLLRGGLAVSLIALNAASYAARAADSPVSREEFEELKAQMRLQWDMLSDQQQQLEEQREIIATQQRQIWKQESELARALQGLPAPGADGGTDRLGDAVLRYDYPGHWQGGPYLVQTPPEPRAPVLENGDQPLAPVPLPPLLDEGEDGDQPLPPLVDDGEPVVPPTAEPGEVVTPGDEPRPESEKPTDQLLLEAGGILLPPGRLQIEPGVEYSHFSTDRVTISGFSIFDAIVIGQIRVDDLERDIVTGSMTARYGLVDRVQVEARVPGVFRQDSELLGVGTADVVERDTDIIALGDVEATVSYQPIIGQGWIPDTIVRVRGTFPTGENPFDIDRESVGAGGETRLEHPPTGSGFYQVAPGTTLVWRVDPVVLFTGGSVTHSFERDFNDFGTITPGMTYEWFAGMNFGFSETVSLNLSFVNQISEKTEQEGEEIAGSDVNDARLVVGASIGLGAQTSLLVTAGVGLTDESPDFTFNASVPINFDIFR